MHHPASLASRLLLPLALFACGPSTPSDPAGTSGVDALTLVSGPSPIHNGQLGVVFSVAVLNVGDTAASAVQVDGTVDAPLVLGSASAAGWTCTVASNTYSCQHPGPLNATGSLPAITLAVTTPLPGSGPAAIDVCAEVSAKGDGNASNDAHCLRLELLERTADYDLVLTKGLLNDTALNSGSPATYEVVVQNLGPDAVGDAVSFSDTLPAELTILGVGPPLSGEWSCTTVAQTVTCTRTPGMALFETDTILVYVTVADQARGDIENCATLSAAQDSNPANDSSCHTGTIPEPAPFDVEVMKTVWAPYTGGPGMSYQIVLTNHGPNPTNGLVKLVDVLPPGLTLTGYSGSILWSCTAASSTVTCLLPTSIAVGASEYLGLTIAVAPGTVAPFVNCIDVVATGDTDPSNNQSCTESTAQIDLVTTKELIGEVVFGGLATYEVTITNMGNTPIPWPITIADPLPNGVSRNSTLVVSGAWACSSAYYWSIVCSYTGPLPVPLGALGTIRYTVNVPSIDDLKDLGVTGTLSNCVTAQPVGPDMTPDDNTSCAQAPIPYQHEVVTAVTTLLSARSGGRARYLVSVENQGTAAVGEPITAAFDLPAPVDFLGTLSPGWDCDSDKAQAEHVVCTYRGATEPGVLPPLEVDLWVGSSAGVEFELCFEVSPADNNLANNDACETVVVGGDPDCNGHTITPHVLYYAAELQAAAAGLVSSMEPFTHDDLMAPIAPGSALRDGDSFEMSGSLVVRSQGASAQTVGGSPVQGSVETHVDWQGDGATSVVRSFVGDEAERGHDGLVFDFAGGVRAAAVRPVDIDKPLWLSVYDTSDELVEVFAVEPGSQLVGVSNMCGTDIGALMLEPGADPRVAAGTDAWGVSRVMWAAE